MIDQRAANRWAARIIPVWILLIFVYTSWVVTKQVCIDYLLNPPQDSKRPPRQGAAIAVLIIYFLLLFFNAITYLRLLHTVNSNPGYVPRGPAYQASIKSKGHSRRESKRSTSTGEKSPNEDVERNAAGGGSSAGYQYPPGIFYGRPGPQSEQPGLADFYTKDVFVCEGDGRPIWCSTCMNWKPDRTHHCSEVARCVRKMDHFCPWVGGIVSETNFKFFIQFTGYVSLITVLVLVLNAVCIAEIQQDSGIPNIHMIIMTAIAGLFAIFGIGMTGSSLQFILVNTTSVENLSRSVKTWTLAVYIPHPPPPTTLLPYKTITYPLTTSSQTPPRTFAILHSKAGENPYDLGWHGNFISVMGRGFWNAVLPIKYSPCSDHSSSESDFELGPVVKRMRQEAGIVWASDAPEHGKRRRRKSSRSAHKEKAPV